MPGLFIVLEGPDGTGKTTQAELLAQRLTRHLGDPARPTAVQLLREPGDTLQGERIRKILLDPALDDMCVETEMFLYMAARAQLVRSVLKPALARGDAVVMDRYYHSTVVYQGVAGGLGVRRVMDATRTATGGLKPDRVILLDIDPLLGMRRGRRRGRLDRMELKGLAFQKKVRRAYLDLALRDPAIVVVDASRPREAVAEAVWKHVKALL